jgi:hypothetical protein
MMQLSAAFVPNANLFVSAYGHQPTAFFVNGNIANEIRVLELGVFFPLTAPG